MLYELINGIKTLSVIGMCKNAGKTTVLNSLISECERHGETLGLTSIGRDGERSDLVTNTKKPEIFVSSGTLIATASTLLNEGDISMEVLETTGLSTPMGEIVVVRARSAGFVQLGGASITLHQRIIRDSLLSFGADRVMIDGAISRKSLGTPSLCEGVILSSGASYDPSIEKTVEDTAYFARLFTLPHLPLEPGPLRFRAVRGGEHCDAEKVEELIPFLKNGAEALLIRGAVTDAMAAAFVNAGRCLKNTVLAAEDASRLLLKKASFDRLLRTVSGAAVMKTAR